MILLSVKMSCVCVFVCKRVWCPYECVKEHLVCVCGAFTRVRCVHMCTVRSQTCTVCVVCIHMCVVCSHMCVVHSHVCDVFTHVCGALWGGKLALLTDRSCRPEPRGPLDPDAS